MGPKTLFLALLSLVLARCVILFTLFNANTTLVALVGETLGLKWLAKVATVGDTPSL